MVWGAISRTKTYPLMRVDTKLNGEAYAQILKEFSKTQIAVHGIPSFSAQGPVDLPARQRTYPQGQCCRDSVDQVEGPSVALACPLPGSESH